MIRFRMGSLEAPASVSSRSGLPFSCVCGEMLYSNVIVSIIMLFSCVTHSCLSVRLTHAVPELRLKCSSKPRSDKSWPISEL